MEITILEVIISILISALTAIAVIGISWGKLTQGFKDLKERFDKFEKKIEDRLNKVGEKVSHLEGRIITPYRTTSSPVRLTEEGERILSESGAKEIVDNPENKQKILEKILTEPKPTNAYDAQEKTREVIKNMVDDPIFVVLKRYAFDKGIDIYVLLDTVGLYFRRYVLEELGFKVEDLDNH